MNHDTSSVSQYDWEQMPTLVGMWIFQPSEDELPDMFFETEEQACEYQRRYRIERGFHPITGERT